MSTKAARAIGLVLLALAACSDEPKLPPCSSLPGCPTANACCNAATLCTEQICEGKAYTCRATESGGFAWLSSPCPAPDGPLPRDASQPTCTASPRTCGATPTSPCAPGDKCGGSYKGSGTRGWPVSTDANGPSVNGSPGCSDSSGKVWPGVGVGSATWFGFLDCGTYKEFEVHAGCRFAVVTYNDCCAGCTMKEIDLEVQERVGGAWTTRLAIKHPYPGDCASYNDAFTPTTSLVRLKQNLPFYVCVFEE